MQISRQARPVSAKISVQKQPGLVTRGWARLFEDFENLNAENSVSKNASSDHATEDVDGFQILEKHINNAKSSSGEEFLKE